jgi:hypothetical protein
MLRRRACFALVLSVLVLPAGAEAQSRRLRRPCASHSMSCVPGPCCRGTKCVDGVCKRPEKDWSDGPKPGEWTPDNPRPLDDKPAKKHK